MTHDPALVPDIHVSIRQPDGQETSVVLSNRRDRYVIGRFEPRMKATVDVSLNDRHASRRHCEIVLDGGTRQWTIRDMLSSNGTQVDGVQISDVPSPLLNGQTIRIGLSTLTVTFESPAAGEDATLTAPPAGLEFEGDQTITGAAATVMMMDATTALQRAGDGVEDDRTTMLPPGGFDPNSTMMVAPPATALEDDGRTEFIATAAPPASPGESLNRPPRGAPGPTAAAAATAPAAPTPSPAMRRSQRIQKLRGMGLRGIALDLAVDVFPDEARLTALCTLARETGQTFFSILANDGSIKVHDEIYNYISKLHDLELIRSEKDLMERAVEADWLSFAHASSLGAVLLSGGDAATVYGTYDPYNLLVSDWIAASSGASKVRKVLVLPTVFHAALQRLKNRAFEDEGSGAVLVIDLDAEVESEIKMRIESVEVPKIVNYFLQKSFFDGSSDIHIEPTEEYLLVRNRVDGMLHELTTLPSGLHPEIASRIKILSGMDVAEKRRPQDGRIATVIRDNAIDVRVSSYPTIYGEKVVMRLLDKNALRPSPEHLGMISRDLRLLYDKLDAPFGLVMISGPTGSGKTTSLYSCLSYIDKKTKNVLTVEDPVEYRLKGVHQMQVNEKIGLTFASGLRTILRQDPDVIMVGECRDQETAGMAIQAALTGHIVFSTIHTNDAIGVITRLIDMGVEPFLVANALTMCIAQRLVRKVCNHCQAPVEGHAVLERLYADGISDQRLASLGIVIDPELTYVSGQGCVHCRNTGYQGRQAVFEVLEVTTEVRQEIVSPSFNADTLRRRARSSGMTTLIGSGLLLVDEGITTHSEIIRVLGEAY